MPSTGKSLRSGWPLKPSQVRIRSSPGGRRTRRRTCRRPRAPSSWRSSRRPHRARTGVALGEPHRSRSRPGRRSGASSRRRRSGLPRGRASRPPSGRPGSVAEALLEEAADLAMPPAGTVTVTSPAKRSTAQHRAGGTSATAPRPGRRPLLGGRHRLLLPGRLRLDGACGGLLGGRLGLGLGDLGRLLLVRASGRRVRRAAASSAAGSGRAVPSGGGVSSSLMPPHDARLLGDGHRGRSCAAAA
jgi:hypothetical protein